MRFFLPRIFTCFSHHFQQAYSCFPISSKPKPSREVHCLATKQRNSSSTHRAKWHLPHRFIPLKNAKSCQTLLCISTPTFSTPWLSFPGKARCGLQWIPLQRAKTVWMPPLKDTMFAAYPGVQGTNDSTPPTANMPCVSFARVQSHTAQASLYH